MAGDLQTNLLIKVLAENKTTAAFNQLNASLNQIKTAAIALGAVLASRAIWEDIINSTRTWGKEVDQLRDELGGTAEQMSKLNYIAHAVGLTTDEISQTFGILAKKIADSIPEIQKGTSEFDKWNIKLKDGHGGIVGFDEALRRVKDRFKEVGQNAQGSALLLDIFSRKGKSLSDFLALTDDQMKVMIQEAEDFGLVLSESGANSIEEFNRKLNRMELQLTGIKLQIGQALIPILKAVLDWFRQNAGAIKAFGAAIGQALGHLKLLWDGLVKVWEVLKPIALTLAAGIKTLFDTVGSAANDFGTMLHDLFAPPDGTIPAAFSALGTKAQEIFGPGGVIGTAFSDFGSLVQRTANQIQYNLEVAWAKIQDAVGGVIVDLQNSWTVFTAELGAASTGIPWLDKLLSMAQQFIAWVSGGGGGGISTTPPPGGIGPTAPGQEEQAKAAMCNSVPGFSWDYATHSCNLLGVVPIAHAAGGIVTRPQMGLVGEAGPEAIIPLDRMGGMGTSIVVNVGSVDSRERADEIADVIMRRLMAQRQLNF